MKFPETYLKHKKVRIGWTYAWGKVDGVFFHCAHFDVIKDGIMTNSTHISIHDPNPHYYEMLGDKFSMFLNATTYEANGIKIFVKDRDPYIKQKGHCRDHRYSTGCYVTLLKDHKTYHGIGWCGTEDSNKHWADIIYEEDGEPIVDNWEWVAINLDDGRKVMVYNTTREQYCCLIKDGVAKRSKNFDYRKNYLNLPEHDLKITIVPMADEKVFSPEVGMNYSEQPFSVLSNQGNGVGLREITYGDIKLDREVLYNG